MARMWDPRFGTESQGNPRCREWTVLRCRLRSRLRSVHPIPRSRHGSVFVPASNRMAAQPAPLPVGHEGADPRPEGTPVAKVGVPVDEGVPQLPPSGSGTGSTRSGRSSDRGATISGCGSEAEVRTGAEVRSRTGSSRTGGSVRMPWRSSLSSIPRQAPTPRGGSCGTPSSTGTTR